MNTNKSMSCILMAICSSMVFADAGTGTNKLTVAGLNTPITAYDWTLGANWQDTSYYPSGKGAGANIAAGSDKAVRFVKLPDSLTLGQLIRNSAGLDYLLGKSLTLETEAQVYVKSQEVVVYADVNLKTADNRLYETQLAGDIEANDCRPYFCGLTQRCDLYSNASGASRENPVVTDTAPWLLKGGYLLYAPRGAAETIGTWNQTAGSPYLELNGESHPLAVGTGVTGSGIPEGTFLKRILGDSWIELSQNVTDTIEGNQVTFAGFSPEFSQTFSRMVAAHADTRITLFKQREDDQAQITFNAFDFGNSSACGVTLGLLPDDVENGYLPGYLEFVSVTTTEGAAGSNVKLGTSRLLLTGKKGNLAFEDLNFSFVDASSVAELYVPTDTTVMIDSFATIDGTLKKTGMGALTILVKNASNGGCLVVSEGSLIVSNRTESAAAIEFANIEIGEKGVLDVPDVGITVANVSAVTGARVSGGKLTVTRSAVGIPTPVGGAEVSVPAKDCSAAVIPEAGRWMHLDASVSSSLTVETLNGTNFVEKMFDVDGNGTYAANGNTAVEKRPWLRANASNGMTMLDMGPSTFARGTKDKTPGDGKLPLPSRDLSFYTADGVAYKGGDETAAPYKPEIHAAFFAVGSEYGGGALLSSFGSSYNNYGMLHWAEDGLNAPIINWNGSQKYNLDLFTTTSINEGSQMFRVNGETGYPRKDTYSGGFDVISLTNAATVSLKSAGLGRSGASANYNQSANGLLYGEVILFTNGIDAASMLDVEAYLSKKWLGRKTPGYDLTVGSLGGMTGNGSKISVMGGGVIETSRIVSGGTVEGDVCLLTNGEVDAVIGEDGSLTAFSVVGNLTLPKTLTIRISGFSNKIKGGSYDLVSATTLLGVTEETSIQIVKPEGCTREFKAKIEGNKIVLTVVPPGLVIVVK